VHKAGKARPSTSSRVRPRLARTNSGPHESYILTSISVERVSYMPSCRVCALTDSRIIQIASWVALSESKMVFKRKEAADKAQSQFAPGVRPSIFNRCCLISSGIESLDAAVGGTMK
jgi:hypothetical protein